MILLFYVLFLRDFGVLLEIVNKVEDVWFNSSGDNEVVLVFVILKGIVIFFM